MAKHLDPALERDQREIRPQDRNETVGHKDDNPSVFLNNLPKTNLPGKKDTNARYKQRKDKARIQRAPFFHGTSAYLQAKNIEPLGEGPRANERQPKNRNPKGTAYIGPCPKLSPEK